jgi:hypothetical protein
MLSRRPCSEVSASDEHCAILKLLLIENKIWIVTPCRKETIFESTASYSLEIDGRNNLIGIDIASAQRNSGACVLYEFFHGFISSQIRW